MFNIKMQKQILFYNDHRQKSGDEPIAIGIGLHTGTLYLEDHLAQAQQVFEQILRKNQQDKATQLYIKRCQRRQNFGVSELNSLIS
jgi:two-component system sensor histidine kinase ChiS